MITAQKIRIAKSITKILKWNIDPSKEKVHDRVKIAPHYANSFLLAVAQESHLNEPNSDETTALQRDLNVKTVGVKTYFKKTYLTFEMPKETFVKETLTDDINQFFVHRTPQTIVVDFSSPNIAKPFHFGHLRSTMIGNFIANINEFAGNKVIRINYLGDWGVQFGLLKVGLQDGGYTKEEIAAQPLTVFHKAYVEANMRNDAGEHEVIERAKKIFHDLEFAREDSDEIQEWRQFRKYTMDELQRIYRRLGIRFDEYSWESDYSAKRIQPLIDKMINDDLVQKESDNALMIRVCDVSVPFMKQDGTTLYISRDTAAAIDRYERYKFDKMYYVVDAAQMGHFATLVAILQKMGNECADKIDHMAFGRIHGMSTRKGQVVWLEDIINEASERMAIKQTETSTTKASIGGEISETLGLSAIIINDLKRKLRTQYKFDWESTLQIEGYTGGKLQYCHCRLVSLEKNCEATLPTECDPAALPEREALELVYQISRFQDIILESLKTSEACILVTYLFGLCDQINKAFPKLKIKGTDTHVASQRLLLFLKAREVLNNGMRILGLKPLSQM